MAGRGDCGDGAGARQHVFLLPGKHTRPLQCDEPGRAGRESAQSGGRGWPRARTLAGPTSRAEPGRSLRGLCAPLGPACPTGFSLGTHYPLSWSHVTTKCGFQNSKPEARKRTESSAPQHGFSVDRVGCRERPGPAESGGRVTGALRGPEVPGLGV